MCLIERLPTKIIDFPIAWCGGEYIGGMPEDEAPVVTKKPRKRKGRKNRDKIVLRRTSDAVPQMSCRLKMANDTSDRTTKESHGWRGRKKTGIKKAFRRDLRDSTRYMITL
jgi:hypothetical protein